MFLSQNMASDTSRLMNFPTQVLNPKMSVVSPHPVVTMGTFQQIPCNPADPGPLFDTQSKFYRGESFENFSRIESFHCVPRPPTFDPNTAQKAPNAPPPQNMMDPAKMGVFPFPEVNKNYNAEPVVPKPPEQFQKQEQQQQPPPPPNTVQQQQQQAGQQQQPQPPSSSTLIPAPPTAASAAATTTGSTKKGKPRAPRKNSSVNSDRRPHECPYCEKKFKRKDKLTNHLRVHTGERPYKCTLCEKDFSRDHHLKRHKNWHSGEKLYSCDICNKAFARKDSLNNHMKKTHWPKPPIMVDKCVQTNTSLPLRSENGIKLF